MFRYKKTIAAAALILLVAAFAFPKILSRHFKKKWPEVVQNLNGIRVAQLYHHSKFGAYVDCNLYPSKPNQSTQVWDIQDSGGFLTLGWAPDGPVRSSYWVTLRNNGTDFVVTGITDLDGDGVFATYVATKTQNASTAPINGSGVY